MSLILMWKSDGFDILILILKVKSKWKKNLNLNGSKFDFYSIENK